MHLRHCCCCAVQVDQLSQVGSMKGALKLLQAAVDQGSVSVLVKGALQVRRQGSGVEGRCGQGSKALLVKGALRMRKAPVWWCNDRRVMPSRHSACDLSGEQPSSL